MSWRAEAFAKMKTKKITNIMLAKHLQVSPQFISEVLNGREIKNGKCTKEKILTAIDEIIASREREK